MRGATTSVLAIMAVVALVGTAPAGGKRRVLLPKAATRTLSLPWRGGIGTFTPASADPRLAAALIHANVNVASFHFTPSGASGHSSRGVTVAVRTRASSALASTVGRTALPASALAPTAYDLGIAVGWKKFALTGDYKRADFGLIEGAREGADLGVSFTHKRWTSRIGVEADRAFNAPAALGAQSNVAVDVGGSYRLTRNLDLTAGVQYKRESERTDQLFDNRRDSQAVYVGTHFKF